MTNSRILHAAARGARIQVNNYFGKWMSVQFVATHRDCYRIHPDDLALQYGPISTALRAWSLLEPSNLDDMYIAMGRTLLDCDEADWFSHYKDELHRYLYLQFLAEALADEGM